MVQSAQPLSWSVQDWGYGAVSGFNTKRVNRHRLEMCLASPSGNA
ncbi:MAG TPA: hypothetical protein VKT82_07280 [Ktedonobacterales bacterium]|nr:hypothetical protein [Ktedonobacterales bacterium]